MSASPGSPDDRFGTNGTVVFDFGMPYARLISMKTLSPQNPSIVVLAVTRPLHDVATRHATRLMKFGATGVQNRTFGGVAGHVSFENSMGPMTKSWFGLDLSEIQNAALHCMVHTVQEGTLVLADTHMIKISDQGAVDSAFLRPSFSGAEDLQRNGVLSRMPDGNILAASCSRSEILIQLYEQETGDRVLPFGTGGFSSIRMAEPSLAHMIVDNNSRIVILGSAINQTRRYFIARLLPDGAFDTSWGASPPGVLWLSQEPIQFSSTLFDGSGRVALQEGSYVVAVYGVLVRHDIISGNRDSSFGQGGFSPLQASGQALIPRDMTEGERSELIVVGRNPVTGIGFAMVFDENGIPEGGFGSSGLLELPLVVEATAVRLARRVFYHRVELPGGRSRWIRRVQGTRLLIGATAHSPSTTGRPEDNRTFCSLIGHRYS
jgi:hypothetical protein